MFSALLKVSLRRQQIENIQFHFTETISFFSGTLSFTLKLRSLLARYFFSTYGHVQGQYHFDLTSFARI